MDHVTQSNTNTSIAILSTVPSYNLIDMVTTE